jgi:hypothetical protein|tara:strand:- start:155 stop:829 length:675 start_codon:yes stop_codon:yes gene_type:complete
MRAGVNVKYTHSAEELICEAASMPEFAHLSSDVLSKAILEGCPSRGVSHQEHITTWKKYRRMRRRIVNDSQLMPEYRVRLLKNLEKDGVAKPPHNATWDSYKKFYLPEVEQPWWKHGLSCIVCKTVWHPWEEAKRDEDHRLTLPSRYERHLVSREEGFDHLPSLCPDCRCSLTKYVRRTCTINDNPWHSHNPAVVHDEETYVISWLANYTRKVAKEVRKNGYAA